MAALWPDVVLKRKTRKTQCQAVAERSLPKAVLEIDTGPGQNSSIPPSVARDAGLRRVAPSKTRLSKAELSIYCYHAFVISTILLRYIDACIPGPTPSLITSLLPISSSVPPSSPLLRQPPHLWVFSTSALPLPGMRQNRMRIMSGPMASPSFCTSGIVSRTDAETSSSGRRGASAVLLAALPRAFC